MVRGKTIVLGVTGSVAVYKAVNALGVNEVPLWDPSQSGLVPDCPHRHSAVANSSSIRNHRDYPCPCSEG